MRKSIPWLRGQIGAMAGLARNLHEKEVLTAEELELIRGVLLEAGVRLQRPSDNHLSQGHSHEPD